MQKSWLDRSVNDNKGVEFISGVVKKRKWTENIFERLPDFNGFMIYKSTYPLNLNMYTIGCDPYDHGQPEKEIEND